MTVKLYAISDIDQSAPVGEWARAIKWPLLSREMIARQGISNPLPAGARYVLIQTSAPTAFEVFFEGQDATPPGDTSPVIEGTALIQAGPGWRISVSEVA